MRAALHQALLPDTPANGNGHHHNKALSWAELRARVCELRKAHPSSYIFQAATPPTAPAPPPLGHTALEPCSTSASRAAPLPFQADTVCSRLEQQQLADGKPGGAVPLFLCAASAELSPPVPWADLYQCYGSPQSCGPEMARLWRDKAGQLHLLRGLATLLEAWLRWARTGRNAGAAHERSLLESQRQLGIVGHLDWHISELAADWPPSQQDEAAQLGALLRTLREDLTNLSSLA